ncbi:uncharacterized protein [Sinocyclocheilus grahami]|uniref:uncharacterized protein n=1 Tax=Sinocyclocheilus grahami TaxID=75366 RepID=UPI0007ACC303|nr:PREDICTED: uncharacterized protein LOC107573051 [Sinocyclocheilus grahami]
MSAYEEREQEAPVDTSPGFNCVSMESNNLMCLPPDLSDGPAVTFDSITISRKRKRAASPLQPPDLSDEAVPFDPVGGRPDQIRYVSCPTFTSSYSQNQISHHDTEAAQQHDSHQPVHDDLQRVKDQHKTSMKNKHERLFEGIKLQQNQTLLNRIYTQLYIIEGESEGVNEEHEVLQMEKSYRTGHSNQLTISRKRKRAASPLQPPDLSDEAVPFDPVPDQIRYVSCPTFTSSYSQNQISHHDTEAAQQHDSHQPVHDDLQRVKDQHKTSMKNKYESLFEGIKLQQNQTLLNRIYTQLYIIEGESEGVNEEHEVLQMEKSYRTGHSNQLQ